MKKTAEEKGKKKGLRFYIPMVLVISVVIILSVVWYSNYSSYISTDDAYIESDKVTVSPQIMGRIVQLYVDEGDTVQKGELLVELDSSDLVSRKQAALAQLTQAQASVRQAWAKLSSEKESIKVVEVENEKAAGDFERAKKQYEGNVITAEQYDHIHVALKSAQARLETAKSQLKVAETLIASSEAAVKSAEAQIDVLDTQIEKTRIEAPSDGVIARRWMLPGKQHSPDSPL